MATPWDDTLKTLVRTSPQAFVDWIAPGARFVRERRCELNKKLEADSLLDVLVGEKLMLLHIEFQSRNDPEMAERLLQYNLMIRREYKLPVLSCVIYLVRDGNVQRSPLIWRLPTGQEVNRFHFDPVEVYKLSPEDIRQVGQPGLLPLLPLTRGGATRRVVKEMLVKLEEEEQEELALTGYQLAALIFKQKNAGALEWLKRSFRRMHDLLRESPVYEWILEEGKEEGLAQGLEQGRLVEARESIVGFVQARYPALERLAEKQVASCGDVERLKRLRMDLYIARNAKKVRQRLLALKADSSGEA